MVNDKLVWLINLASFLETNLNFLDLKKIEFSTTNASEHAIAITAKNAGK